MVLVVVAVVVGLLLLGTSFMAFMGGGMMGVGGMMGGGSGGGYNVGGILLLVVLASIFVAIVVMLLQPGDRERVNVYQATTGQPLYYAPQPAPAAVAPPAQVQAVEPPPPMDEQARAMRLQETTMVKFLDEDERNLYTTIRERGGEMLQKDIVASGSFSKAKVTRLLDRLESKGVVVRERHGMTNKVRLTTMPPKASGPT